MKRLFSMEGISKSRVNVCSRGFSRIQLHQSATRWLPGPLRYSTILKGSGSVTVFSVGKPLKLVSVWDTDILIVTNSLILFLVRAWEHIQPNQSGPSFQQYGPKHVLESAPWEDFSPFYFSSRTPWSGLQYHGNIPLSVVSHRFLFHTTQSKGTFLEAVWAHEERWGRNGSMRNIILLFLKNVLFQFLPWGFS